MRSPSFLEEFAMLRRQEIKNRLRRAAEAHTLRRDHDRAIHENRMRLDRVEKRRIRKVGIIETQLMIRCALFAQDCAQRYTHARDQLREHDARRRGLEIFDDVRPRRRHCG